MVTSLDRASISYADRLQLADDYCNVHNMPAEIRQRMTAAMKTKFSERKVLKVQALQQLPGVTMLLRRTFPSTAMAFAFDTATLHSPTLCTYAMSTCRAPSYNVAKYSSVLTSRP